MPLDKQEADGYQKEVPKRRCMQGIQFSVLRAYIVQMHPAFPRTTLFKQCIVRRANAHQPDCSRDRAGESFRIISCQQKKHLEYVPNPATIPLLAYEGSRRRSGSRTTKRKRGYNTWNLRRGRRRGSSGEPGGRLGSGLSDGGQPGSRQGSITSIQGQSGGPPVPSST